jgi:hypothetical protein
MLANKHKAMFRPAAVRYYQQRTAEPAEASIQVRDGMLLWMWALVLAMVVLVLAVWLAPVRSPVTADGARQGQYECLRLASLLPGLGTRVPPCEEKR